jgi:hypothetical protein
VSEGSDGLMSCTNSTQTSAPDQPRRSTIPGTERRPQWSGEAAQELRQLQEPQSPTDADRCRTSLTGGRGRQRCAYETVCSGDANTD